LDSLGFIASHTNRHGEAIDFYLRALTLFRDLGHAYQEADTLVKLGDAYVAFGHLSGARDAWHQALDLFEKQHRKTDAEKIEAQLADLDDNSS
jgi:tetratricopeptide (TPR) repeat protein